MKIAAVRLKEGEQEEEKEEGGGTRILPILILRLCSFVPRSSRHDQQQQQHENINQRSPFSQVCLSALRVTWLAN
ncbi:hypothetical protein E2C01_095784 [Portunus trituberculatus]|uniref:Uncharacterized protein n=1 Tax=Portunus trituberculatus TaxID=210409 RepID=A0A5B7JZQ7_PORTR|nr:hypothetical protein [Portunus trituberculatus]